MRLRAAIVAALAAAMPAGCTCGRSAPPTERLAVVVSPRAPGLSEPEGDEAASRTLHEGDAVIVRKSWPPIRWQGTVEGVPLERPGEVLEVARAAQDGVFFLFAEDVRRDVALPAASWICRTAPPSALAAGPCEGTIQRVRVRDEDVAAFLPCFGAGCPVAFVRRGTVTWASIDGLQRLQRVVLGGRAALLATARWMRSPEQTGGTAVLLDAAPALARLGDLRLDEVDSRRLDRVVSRQGDLRVEPDALRFVGERREQNAATGEVLSTTPVDERLRLAPRQ